MSPPGGGVALTVDGNSTSAGAGFIVMSSGTITLAGGPNVTLSQNGNAVSISAAAGGGGTQTAISGISASNTVYTSGTVDLEGSGGGITVGSAAGQKVILSVAAPIAQSKQTDDLIDLTLSGNTAGALALMSSGTVTLAGGQGITLSQAGNAVTISGSTFSQSSQPQSNQAGSVYASSNTFGTSSGTYDARSISIAGRGAVSVAASNSGWIISAPVQSAQPAQTGISGISASNTVYTSGTVAITGVGGGVTVSSNTGQRVDISVAAPVAQSVQTQSRFDMTLAGNSTSAGAGFIEMSSGTVTLAGGNNITISQNGNALTISGPNVGGAQTGISGIAASNTVYTSGSVTITGVGGGVTVSSNTGQRVDISVAAQTNQAGSVYASSNTFGTSSGTFDARTLSIAGSGAVSVAASNSGWVISAPAQSVQPQTNQAGSVYASSNTFGTSSGTYDARTLSIAGVGAVQVAASNSGWRISAPVQTNQAGSVYASSNTFGTSSGTFDARTLSIAGSGIVGVAASNSGWVISATSSQSVQAGSVYASSNTFGTSSGTYDARTLSVAGSGAVSVAASNSGWVISAPAATNLSVGASTGGNTAGDTTVATGSRLVFAGGNNITVSQGTAAGATTLTISGANVGGAQTGISGIVGSNATYTSGTVTFTGVGGGVTVSSNTGQRIDISVAAPVAQTNQAGSVYASSNTFGTSSGTYDARTLSIAGDGIVSVAASNSGWRISATQSTQLGSVYASSNTFGTSSGTYNAKTLSIAGSGAVSVAASNSGWVISAPSQTNQAGSVYAISNTQGTSSGTYDARTLSIAGEGIITVAASNSGWRISASQSVQTQSRFNLTVGGNSTSGGAGFALVSSGVMTLAGGPNITISQAGNAISISGGAGGTGGGGSFSAGVSTAGNTAGDTGITGTRLVFAATNPMSLSQATDANGGTISINSPATSSLSATGMVSISTNGSTISIGAPNPSVSFYDPPMPLLMGATQGIGASAATRTTVTAWVMPMTVPWDLAFNNLNVAVHNSFSSATTSISSVNYSYSQGASLGFYTLTGSTFSLVTSFSGSLGYTNATAANVTNLSASVIYGIGGSSTTASTQGGANLGNIMSSINSVRKMGLNWTTTPNTLTRGQYWAVACFSQLTGGAAHGSLSQVGFVSSRSIMGSAYNPPEMLKSTASVTSPYPFLGQATLVNSSDNLMVPSFETSKITTATAIANSTKFQSIWFQMYSSHSN